MTNIIVMGASGRMGSTILRLVKEDPELSLAGAVERADSPAVGQDTVLFGGDAGVKITSDLASVIRPDAVVIDFTHPDATMLNIEAVAKTGAACVIGTTGIDTDRQVRIAGLAGTSFPCVLSPNMSLGVNVLFKLVEQTAKILGDEYDVEIVEIHHRFKKDAPSGTAVKLGQVAAQALGRDYAKDAVYERKGMCGERTTKEIGMQTLRAGDVVGEHTVIFGSLGERIELTHRAHSRENFARGAIRAAKWVAGKAPGLYTMYDVLGL